MAVEPTMPIYPASDLDRAETILSFLGSLWATSYAGMHQVVDLIEGKAALERQTHLDLLELVASTSRFEVPIFHTDNWYLLTLKESELNNGTSALPKYDGTYNYGVGGISYGVPVEQEYSVWDLEVPLVQAPMLLNRITGASLTMTEGSDYILEEDAIKFRDNPFDNSLIAKRDIIDSDGNISDRELGLWVFRGKFDYENLYKQFGYVLQVRLDSDENYRKLINAVMDALVEGSAIDHMEQLLSAVTGVPLVRYPTETVEQVIDEVERKLVITDREVYQFAATSTILVAVGDELLQGAPMCDGLLLYDMQRGDTPPAEYVPALTTGRGFLAEGYFGDLTWPNADVALTTWTDTDGKVRVRWPLGGWPGDEEQFFDELHARGLAAGTTMAQLLDPRPNASGEPPEGALPSTINPMQFLAANVLRNNGIIAVIRIDDGVDGVGLKAARLLRKIIPPHVMLLIVITVPHAEDPITMEGAGSETEPGYEEAVVSFSAGSTSDSLSGLTSVSEEVTVRSIGGRCA